MFQKSYIAGEQAFAVAKISKEEMELLDQHGPRDSQDFLFELLPQQSCCSLAILVCRLDFALDESNALLKFDEKACLCG